MGIVDDLETCIIEHISVGKRHDSQQRVVDTARSCRQLPVSRQMDTDEMSRQQDEISQLLSVTQQDLVSREHFSSRSQHFSSASSSEETLRRISLNSSSDASSATSDNSDIQRSPRPDRSLMPLSPFRECLSLIERLETSLDVSKLQRDSQSESIASPPPCKSRLESTWFEQSDLCPGNAEDERTFSYENVRCCSPESQARRQVCTSSDDNRIIESEFRLPYSTCTTVEGTISDRDPLPQDVSLPRRLDLKISTHQMGQMPDGSIMPPKEYTSETNCTSISMDQESYDTLTGPSHSSRSQQLGKYNVDISVTTVSKPKLVRLQSEPCAFGTLTSEEMLFGQQYDRLNGGRKRDELKRSQSFEVNSSSYAETLWPRGNLPGQILATRPQLLSRLKGNNISLHLEDLPGDLNFLRGDPPLQFHDTHGDNVELQNNKVRARRHESFCKGICFSNRPIAINEKVYIKFVETNTNWSGVLRFGFTSIDPVTVRGCDLPRYACPDLTNKPGNWAKALGERYTASNILLHFSVNRAGDVAYGVNGEDKGIFFNGVITSQPLWALLDIYGNTVTVEFSHANAEIEPPASASQFDISPQPLDCNHFNFSNLSLSNGPRATSAVESTPRVYWHASVTFTPLQFHHLLGRNVLVCSDRSVATRLKHEYCNAFVFTARPIHCGETLVIQVLAVDRSFIGGLGFGVTACNPASVDPESLPDDSDLLLDRLEYWVVNKDVCRNPEIGDELSFNITELGEVRYSRNNHAPVTLMHVDRTLPLWAFFDVYGNIQKIKLIGTTLAPCQGRLPRSQSLSSYSNVPSVENMSASSLFPAAYGMSALTATMPSTVSGGSGSMGINILRNSSSSIPSSCLSSVGQNAIESSISHPGSTPSTPLSSNSQALLEVEIADCKVCWERVINCVLYTCGHMCLCFDCAMTIRGENGLCPICRQAIVDVIKIYKS